MCVKKFVLFKASTCLKAVCMLKGNRSGEVLINGSTSMKEACISKEDRPGDVLIKASTRLREACLEGGQVGENEGQ